MRQHAAPLLIDKAGHPVLLRALGTASGTSIDEATVQQLVQNHPGCLPIAEIDPLFVDPVPICTELNTPAGPIDNFMVTPAGLPVLVECKLWRNAEARRQVVGQILDYAKELARWSASDLQRETNRRLRHDGNAILDLVRAAGHSIDEIAFNDALTHNLRRGRFLLLIVGDGIRERVEAIAEYLQGHAGLHFTLGLVEMPIYEMPDGSRLVAPRVLARTEVIRHTVVEVPEGYALSESDDGDAEGERSFPETPERRAGRQRRNAVRNAFWRDFLQGLHLDDPEQALPPPALGGRVAFKFGAPGGSSWLSVYRDMRGNRVGLFLSSNLNSTGERASRLLAAAETDLRNELGKNATINFSGERPVVQEELAVADLEQPDDRAKALAWLQDRTNVFINALRPRIRSALSELAEE